MANTFTNLNIHCVFSTKRRERWITPAFEDRIWADIGGIARDLGARPPSIGGVEDHVHLLLSIPSTTAAGEMMKVVKGKSSKWISETLAELRAFAWQEGYGAFSVSASHLAATVSYIRGQREHHRTVTFEEEFVAFLRKNHVEYDERYLWG